MEYSVEKANKYIEKFKSDENDIFRTKYHFMPKCGWCNDPHGLVYFNDTYYLFFQFYPYEPVAKEIHWGYVTTKDFVHFSDVRCALAPNNEYDNSGCWSGSVIVKDNKLYIYYTGFSLHTDNKYYQTVCLATSTDGKNFEKYTLNPVINTSQIPECANLHDFRDPCVFFENDVLYLIIGSKNDHEAMVLLYSSTDMVNFEFEKVLLSSKDYGTMFECPNIVRFKDKAFLIVSPQNVKAKDDNFFNVSSCIYIPLDRDFINKEVKISSIKEIDHGLEYYAPNVCDEEKILVAWQQLWGRRFYLKDIGKPYTNSFSLFKKIVQDGDKLKFIPLDVYKKYFEDEFEINGILTNKTVKKFGLEYHADIEIKTQKGLIFTIELTKKKSESVKLILDVGKKEVRIDRSSLKEQLYGVDYTPATLGKRFLKLDKIEENFKFEIYVDHISIEIYLNDYHDSFHLLSYSLGEDISFKSNKATYLKVLKHNIKVD